MTTPNVGSAYWTPALTQTAVKTSAYTAHPNELVRVDTTTGSVTVTLPAQPAAGTIIAVKMVTLGGSNTVTITAVAGDVLNKAGGSTTATLTLLSQGLVLEYQAGIWMILADDLPLSQIDSRYLPTPAGTATSGQVPVATGTGEASAWGSVAVNPMTTSGDTMYGAAAGALTRLAGDTSNTRKFLREQSVTGTAQPPAWDTLQAADLPGATTSTQGAVILDGTAGDIAALGAQAAGSVGKAADAGHVHPTTGVVLTSSLPLAIGSGGTGQTSAGNALGALGGAAVAGDIGNTSASPQVISTHLSSALPLNQGGTGQASAAAAYNALSPMTTTGDIEYESGAATASRLAGPTSATKQFLTSTGTGSAAQAPAWGAIAAADLPTGTTSTQGALQLDGTAGDIAALGTRAAGAVGKPADAGHVHPVTGLTLADYTQPTGATAATLPRWTVSSNTSVLSSGTLYVLGLSMAAGIAVNNLTFVTGTTVKAGGTHGWYVLLDSNLVVRAVTGDQTDASTVWGAQKTFYTLATNSYTTTYAGLYYVGVMVAVSAGTVPTFAGAAGFLGSVIASAAPIYSGTSSTGQTTPPSTGTTMTSLTAAINYIFYAYTS